MYNPMCISAFQTGNAISVAWRSYNNTIVGRNSATDETVSFPKAFDSTKPLDEQIAKELTLEGIVYALIEHGADNGVVYATYVSKRYIIEYYGLDDINPNTKVRCFEDVIRRKKELAEIITDAQSEIVALNKIVNISKQCKSKDYASNNKKWLVKQLQEEIKHLDKERTDLAMDLSTAIQNYRNAQFNKQS